MADDRRDFLKTLMAGGVAGIPAVKSVEKLELGPNDTIVIIYPGAISDQAADRLKRCLHGGLGLNPTQKVLVLGEGPEIKVIRG